MPTTYVRLLVRMGSQWIPARLGVMARERAECEMAMYQKLHPHAQLRIIPEK